MVVKLIKVLGSNFTLIAIVSICLFISFQGCNDSLNITLDEKYPRWIREGDYQTRQTSGICFIKSGKEGEKHFLLADDIGAIHRLIIVKDTVFSLKRVSFSEGVNEYLKDFPKKDFEEIVFDNHTGKVYISIEGNSPKFIDFVGIYELEFFNNDIFSDSVVDIRKLKIEPSETILKYVKSNIGFEGMAVDKKYFYIGLEGFSSKDSFSDSTLLYIVDKTNMNLVKTINTCELGLGTICGLYSDKDNSLWGIDRNRLTIFHLYFDDNLNIISKKYFDFTPAIPGNRNLVYVAAIESVTLDDERNLYMVDDPYTRVFIPPAAIFNRLDEKTQRNFKTYTPVIYKYKVTY